MMTREAFFESFFLLVLSVVGCRADDFHGLRRNVHTRNPYLSVRERGPSSGRADDFLEAKDLTENHDFEEFLEDRLLMAHNSMDVSTRTSAPIMSPSSPRNAPRNNKCTNAIMLATEGNIAGIPDDDTRVVGSTVDAIYDEASFSCDHGSSRSPALWYAVRGTGETMRADTCSNYTDFDTVISIHEGLCGSIKSTCLVSNDDSCGSLSSSVIWPTELGVDYYIRVAGLADDLVGEFGLRVSTYEAAPNVACSGAIELTKGGTVSASMEGASPGHSTDCFYDDSSAGIWYYVDGLGSALSISTCDQAGKGTFSGRIQVFLGSSSMSGLECMPFAFSNDCSSSSTGSVKFFAEEGERYSILFLGSWDESFDDNNNFTITVTDFEPAKNNRCDGAVRIDNSSRAILVSTEDYLPDSTPCNQDSSSAGAPPSVWYTVQGTGRTMMASTCSGALTMDTSLNVLSGSCDQLACMANGAYNHDATCEGTSFGSTQVVFQTEVDTAYYVLVTDMHSSAMGDSVLTISDVDVPWNDRDTNATMIIPNTETIIGSTRNASGPVFRSDTSDSNNETSCAFAQSPGVWYSLNGTGQGYVLSTCSNETTFETAISVSFDGKECMMIAANNENSCSNGISCASAVIWAEMGVEYLIFVHGASENTRGDFGLTVSSFDFVPNDLCSGALTVLPDNGTIFGSTFEATDSGTEGCSSVGISGTIKDGRNTTVKGITHDTDNDNDFDYDYDYDFDNDNDNDDNDDTADNDKVNNRVFVNDTDTRGGNLTVSTRSRNPDLWYRVDGTGGLLMASTNGDNKTFVSQIEILESENGTCTTLFCVVVNDDPFDTENEVEWFAELGMTYFVRVLGHSQSRGQFQLSVTTP